MVIAATMGRRFWRTPPIFAFNIKRTDDVLAHLSTWKRLPADIKAVIERNVAYYVRLQRQDQQKLNTQARSALGLKLAVNEADSATFRPKLSGVYTTWREKLGRKCWSLLEASSGRLA